ncbi:hypothetical protein [Legionella sp. PC997]|uniref:hypothetical protein n=1 Tax=Legionella sp. PC997 TaxID=2755562 RepID=UPI0015FB2285|nr:hypothetical protein [Legionella sp. PC997]QMT61136.1 hypothetical protein HBNCFIEN_02526 [Legionella sp. PC997]
MKIKKRLIALENGMEDVKTIQLELAEKNTRLQLLIEQMEEELGKYEQTIIKEESAKVNNAELLRAHGLMKQSKQVNLPEPRICQTSL